VGTLSEIPGGGSVAVLVKGGDAVKLVNAPGTQTVGRSESNKLLDECLP